MAISVPNMLKSAGVYLSRHPRVLGEIARYALQRRLAIPLDSLRWLVEQMPAGKSAPQDIVLTAQPPAIGLGATLDLMGTRLRVDAAIHVVHIHATPQELQVTIRVKDLRASVLNNLDGNLAKLLKSGVIDLSKPANTLKMIGNKPKLIADAKDDMFVLDLMQLANVRDNPMIGKVLAGLTPILSVAEVHTAGDTLAIGLRARPSGLKESFANLRP